MSLFFASSAIILPYNWPIRSFGFRAKTQPAIPFLSTASRKPVRGFGSAAVGPVTTLPRGEKFTGDRTVRMLFSPLAVHRPSIKGKR